MASTKCVRWIQSAAPMSMSFKACIVGLPKVANDKLCRLLFFIGALNGCRRRAGDGGCSVSLHARKDRRTKPNDPVTTRYIAEMVRGGRSDCIVTLEVHNPVAFENAFRSRTVSAERDTAIRRLRLALSR